MKDRMLKAALAYKKLGFSVIPCGKDKKPLISWKHYQSNIAGEGEIEGWYKQWPDANIAIVTGKISNLFVIDIDDMVKGKAHIDQAMPDNLSMPIASTPRGGQHLLFQYRDGCRNTVDPKFGIDVRAEGGYILASPSTNGNGIGYKWVVSPKDVKIPALPDAIYNIINSFSMYTDTPSEKSVDTVDTLFSIGRRDNDLFHTANCLIKGGCSKDFILQVLDILAKNCDPPMSTNVHKEKYQSALNRQDSHERNLSNEVRDYVLSTKGRFLSTEIHHFLGLSTRVHKKNVSECLRRLLDEGIIERYGDKNGQFRRIEVEFDIIDKFEIEDAEPLNIEYPLKIDQYSNTHRGNIIIVAGEKEAGKTAFCLKFATMNMNKGMKIRYISTEFGSRELFNRLKRDESITPEDWIKKVEFGQFYRNEYHDAIRPDAINILDFLEIPEGQFYMIAEQIKKIYQKLRKGICLIAIQKKRGQELARGGDLSAEKARLYVSLGREKVGNFIKNVATIVYCKNHANELINPRDFYCYYKLGGGHYFKIEGSWGPRLR